MPWRRGSANHELEQKDDPFDVDADERCETELKTKHHCSPPDPDLQIACQGAIGNCVPFVESSGPASVLDIVADGEEGFGDPRFDIS